MAHTYASLARSSKGTLDAVMKTGRNVPVDDVLGYEFRGWNLNPTTKLTRTRKFKKGFFGTRGRGYAWGYNVAVRQNKFEEPWIGDPSDDDPTRHYYFMIFPGTERARHPNTLVVDYQASDEYFALNPVGYTMDYLVYPEPGNNDLVLGKSYFEAGPIRPFLGYFVLERHNQSGYDRASHVLDERELRTVEAFAEVFIEGETELLTPREIAFNIDRHLDRISSSRVDSLKLILFAIEHVVPRRSWWPFRKSFSKMSVRERRQFVAQAIASGENQGPLRDLSRIKTLFALGYYSDPRTHPGIGFEPVAARPGRGAHLVVKAQPRVTLTDASGVIDCDVCVIGSGAGGAIVAARAAQAGRDVVLLEEGPYVPPEDLSPSTSEAPAETEVTARLYKEGGLQTTVDLDMVIIQGKVLGGTTYINNCISFRLDDPDLTPGRPSLLARWAEFGAHIDAARLAAAYDRVEQELRIGPLLQVQDPNVPPIDGGNARVLLDGWRSIQGGSTDLARFSSGLFRKNKDHCLGCGYCNFGCRWGRKLSMAETYVPAAQAAGARVVAQCHARRVELDGRQAKAVHCRRADGRELTVRAKGVVVSAGAIGSSVLLMKSGITANVGERFSFNAGTPVFAQFPDELRSYDGVQMAAFVDLHDYLLESLFYPPVAFAAALPGWFGTHFQRMAAYRHFACAGVLIGTDHNGRVKRTGQLRELFGPVDYRMTGPDLERMRRGMAMLARVYFAAGADRVLPATFADLALERTEFASAPGDAIERRLAKAIRRPEDLTLSSAHPQGGNPMSDDRRKGVVDSRFRVHGTDNLFVCDASVFPTTIAINPQLTIMAMADYFVGLGELTAASA